MRSVTLLGAIALFLGISAASADPQVTFLYNFAENEAPGAGKILVGGNGALYGTIATGGSYCGSLGCGVVYRLTPGEDGWSKDSVYEFMGNPDGAQPQGLLAQDNAGALYGITSSGGGNASGTVFKLDPPPAGMMAWPETQLHVFNSATEGAIPVDGVISDGAGGYYGATYGGQPGPNAGMVFHLTPPAGGGAGWSYQIVTYLQQPVFASPVLAPDGTLYVATTDSSPAIYKLTPPAPGQNNWSVTNLHQFNNGSIHSRLVRDAVGNLYGTRTNSVFMLSPPIGKSTKWKFKTVFNFTGGNRGTWGQNLSGVILDASGSLYGLTANGGTGRGPNCDKQGCGTLFKLSPPAAGQTKWSVNILVGSSGGRDLTAGPDGTLYGIGPIRIFGFTPGAVFKVTGTGFQPVP